MTRAGRPAALLLALGLSGCVATQRDVLDLSQQTDDVKVQVVDLKKTMASLQANQADLSSKLDQVRGELSAFTETLKDSQTSMGRLSTKIDDLEGVLAQKVAGLGETLSRQQNELAAKIEADRLAAQKEAERAAALVTPDQLIRSGRQHLSKGRHDLAQEALETFLRKYPKEDGADQAAYYLGEVHSARKDREAAARQYALVLDRHPKSKLTPSARLKYAQALIHMKSHIPEARRYLESIPEDFPNSPEAPAARKLLQSLAGPSKPAPR